jgi:hypothetical protein
MDMYVVSEKELQFRLWCLYIRKYLFWSRGHEIKNELKALAVKKVNLISMQFDEIPE